MLSNSMKTNLTVDQVCARNRRLCSVFQYTLCTAGICVLLLWLYVNR
jgi:hypothetical protein